MLPTIALGKTLRLAMRLRGGGSTLPGLVVERIDSGFLKRTLSTLPRGVVVVSGTNGKTTTTKMVAELLESQGLRVFSNPTGSNFTRGIASSLLSSVNLNGKLDADIAVLELDEAHAVHFVNNIKPRHSLLLNVMRDQLDRFGEIDKTVKLLEKIADKTTHKVVLNREDPRVAAIAKKLRKNQIVSYFGLSQQARKHFPNDDETHAGKQTSRLNHKLPSAVTLESFEGRQAIFKYKSKIKKTSLQLDGIYNVFNAAAALALVEAILENRVNEKSLFSALRSITPAFGRGETLQVDGQPLELILVKNPAGFRLALNSFNPQGYATMIAINDNYADGRDMSWLWDVNFTNLSNSKSVGVSGIRAYDMALRLQYDEVKVDNVCTNLKAALEQLKRDNKDRPKRIFCTYTAMLAIRRELGKTLKMEA